MRAGGTTSPNFPRDAAADHRVPAACEGDHYAASHFRMDGPGLLRFSTPLLPREAPSLFYVLFTLVSSSRRYVWRGRSTQEARWLPPFEDATRSTLSLGKFRSESERTLKCSSAQRIEKQRHCSEPAPPEVEALWPGLSRGLAGVDWVVPHQASGASLDSLETLGWPRDRILRSLGNSGNCVRAQNSSRLGIRQACEEEPRNASIGFCETVKLVAIC